MIRSVAFAIMLVVSTMLAPGTVHSEPRLSICHVAPKDQGIGWKRSTLGHVLRVLQIDSEPTSFRIRRAVCNDTMPDASCAGLPKEMFCRQATFDRIQIAAMYVVVAYVNSGMHGYEAFRRAHPEMVGTAFQFADGAVSDLAVMNKVEHISQEVEAAAVGQRLSSEFKRVATIQQRIVAFNIAALVGHESHHMSNEVCPITHRSALEKNGVFDHIVTVQTSGGLFKAAFPDPNEIKADRCAMRQIARLHVSAIGDYGDPDSDESFARRVAADMVAFQILAGFRRFEQLPLGTYVTPRLDEYLFPSFRIALIAGTISDPGSSPVICGQAAEFFVRAVQDDFTTSPGGGEVSDEILNLLPGGVESSWNGAPWTAESVSCASGVN